MPHVRAEDRRRQFVDAAIEVIALEGVAKATTRRIAEQAGAPAATLHYCFRGKDELFQAVFDQASLDVRDIGARSVVPGMGLDAAIESMVRGYVSWVLGNPKMQQAQFELIFWALRRPSARHLPARMYQGYIDSMSQLLREARRPDEPHISLDTVARQILALFDGHMLQNIAQPDVDLGVMIDQGTAMVCASLRRAVATTSP